MGCTAPTSQSLAAEQRRAQTSVQDPGPSAKDPGWQKSCSGCFSEGSTAAEGSETPSCCYMSEGSGASNVSIGRPVATSMKERRDRQKVLRHKRLSRGDSASFNMGTAEQEASEDFSVCVNPDFQRSANWYKRFEKRSASFSETAGRSWDIIRNADWYEFYDTTEYHAQAMHP